MPKKPGRIETRIAWAILALLGIVGSGIYLRQFDFNPAVLALRPEAQPAAIVGGADAQAIIDPATAGVVPFSPPERFTPDTLYEKIDGRADLYLASGFVTLVTQRFTPDRAADGWVEMFVYDMATPESAFSVFSLQRREQAMEIPDLPTAYRTPNALFMAQDRYYLELISADASKPLQMAMERLARGFAATHGGMTAAKLPGGELFPKAGLDIGSHQLIAANAFGDAQLDRVHTADYLVNGQRVTAFVSAREDARAAAALADGYRRTLLSYGAEVVNSPLPMAGSVVLQMFDTVEIVFNRGKYLAGIHEATDPTLAADVARRLAEHLEGLTQ